MLDEKHDPNGDKGAEAVQVTKPTPADTLRHSAFLSESPLPDNLSNCIDAAFQALNSAPLRGVVSALGNLYRRYKEHTDEVVAAGFAISAALYDPLSSDFAIMQAEHAHTEDIEDKKMGKPSFVLSESYDGIRLAMQEFRSQMRLFFGEINVVEYSREVFRDPDNKMTLLWDNKRRAQVLFVQKGEENNVGEYIHEIAALYYMTNGRRDKIKNQSDLTTRKSKLSRTPYLVLEALFENSNSFGVYLN